MRSTWVPAISIITDVRAPTRRIDESVLLDAAFSALKASRQDPDPH